MNLLEELRKEMQKNNGEVEIKRLQEGLGFIRSSSQIDGILESLSTALQSDLDKHEAKVCPYSKQHEGRHIILDGSNPRTDVLANCINGDQIDIICPGFSKKELSIDVIEDSIIVEGSPTTEDENENNIMEYEVSPFRLSFRIFNVDENGTVTTLDHSSITSKFKNGILSIKFNILEPEVKSINIS